MGKLVNVVLPGGKVVSVDEDTAEQAKSGGTSHTETLGEATVSATDKLNEERSAGLGEGLKAGAEGFLDTATFGAFGKVAGNLDENYAYNAQIRAQQRPGARLIGELATLALPGGELGKVGELAGAALPSTHILGAARKVGGLLGEGAVAGVQGYLAQSNVTGDPLTIEGALINAGVGAVLNYGVGKMASGISKKTDQLIARDAANKEAEKAANLFSETPQSYNEMRQIHEDTVRAGRKAAREYNNAVDDYTREADKFTRGEEGLDRLRAVSDRLSKMKQTAEVYASSGFDSAGLPMTPEEKQAYIDFADMLGTKRRAWITTLVDKPTESLKIMEDAIKQGEKLVPGANMPIIPRSPTIAPPAPFSDFRLPGTTKAFAGSTASRIADIANTVQDGTPLAEAINKFAADIGLSAGKTSGETLAGVHGALQGMLPLAAKRAATIEKGGIDAILEAIQNRAAGAVAWGAGRTADRGLGGGFLGALGHTATRAGIGYALDGVQGALVGAALMNGKLGVQDKISSLFVNYGKGTARILKELGPVSAYLSSAFPSGAPDTETDIRKLALNRIADIQSANLNATDASFTATQPLNGLPEDIAYKIHMQVVGAVNHLAKTAPLDPGLAMNMLRSDWRPTASEAMKLGAQLEVVQQPMKALARLVSGGGSQAAANAMWEKWPAVMQFASATLADNAQYMTHLTREQSSALSRTFRIPLNGFSQPVVTAQLATMYLPKPNPNGGVPPSRQPTGGAPGRPSAIGPRNPNQSLVQQLQR